MINRSLIRIKVAQMVYSYLLTKDENDSTPEAQLVKHAVAELEKSFDESHKLYFCLLRLMVDLTDLQDVRLDEARNKFLPSQEDLNPNLRFVENEFIKQLRENDDYIAYFEENPFSWRDDDIFLRLLLDKVTHSKHYQKYMEASASDFAADCELWRNLLRYVILVDDDMLEALESKSVYWNDDLDTMGTFTLKTIRRFQEGEGATAIQPMFKDEEDAKFGEVLLRRTIGYMEENNTLIDSFINAEHWDAERVALMDRVVMSVAITEIKCFADIPLNVSFNEYIEITKSYCSEKSSSFVNGVLNAVAKQLRKSGEIIK